MIMPTRHALQHAFDKGTVLAAAASGAIPAPLAHSSSASISYPSPAGSLRKGPAPPHLTADLLPTHPTKDTHASANPYTSWLPAYLPAYLCAPQVDEAPVWSELGHAYLAAAAPADAIAAYLRANDASRYADVIDACGAASAHEDLVKYLLMVRKRVKEPRVDGELMHAYAVTGALGELDALLHGSHAANLQAVGDRCAAAAAAAPTNLYTHMPWL